MKSIKDALLLYAVTDRSWLGQNSLDTVVEDIIPAGATFIQLREKEMLYEEFLDEAKRIKTITDRHQIPFLINDNIHVALACGADGVHVGQEDKNAAEVRSMMGKNKILGVSVQTVEQAIQAERDGADYLGVGAVFPTSTKADAADVPYDTLKQICASVAIPVVAIGGINENNILQLKGSGVAGAAVISAIFSKPDAAAATRQLKSLVKMMVEA